MGNEFVVAWADATADGQDIVLTQKDIRELQLAKGGYSCRHQDSAKDVGYRG